MGLKPLLLLVFYLPTLTAVYQKERVDSDTMIRNQSLISLNTSSFISFCLQNDNVTKMGKNNVYRLITVVSNNCISLRKRQCTASQCGGHCQTMVFYTCYQSCHIAGNVTRLITDWLQHRSLFCKQYGDGNRLAYMQLTLYIRR